MEHFPCCLLLRLQLPLHCVPSLFFPPRPFFLSLHFYHFLASHPPLKCCLILTVRCRCAARPQIGSHASGGLWKPAATSRRDRTPSIVDVKLSRSPSVKLELLFPNATTGVRAMCGCKCEKREGVYVRKGKKQNKNGWVFLTASCYF